MYPSYLFAAFTSFGEFTSRLYWTTLRYRVLTMHLLSLSCCFIDVNPTSIFRRSNIWIRCNTPDYRLIIDCEESVDKSTLYLTYTFTAFITLEIAKRNIWFLLLHFHVLNMKFRVKSSFPLALFYIYSYVVIESSLVLSWVFAFYRQMKHHKKYNSSAACICQSKEENSYMKHLWSVVIKL